jgi:membrane-bound metal-dependent hydrolase YbcI (DUF457 family)
MPFTPYHFGPSGLLGYVFRKWIDLPVFVFANVIIDIEVLLVHLMHLSGPYHRYSHTFLIGAAVGAVWGLVAYFGLPLLSWFMKKMRIPYKTSVFKMIISGILGVWLHVLIDGIYHYDVKPFWPMRKNHLWRPLSHNQVEWICIVCLGIFVLLYVLSLRTKAPDKTGS